METSVVKRFLRYIAVDTQSAAEKDVIPSTAKQFDLAKILVEELKEMGAQDVKWMITLMCTPQFLQPLRRKSQC